MIMSDPEIIKSSTPHRVSMPEGSSNAVGKKAEVGEASIRKVLSEGSGESNELKRHEEVTKGPASKLSLDEEIAAAKEQLQKNKELRAEKEGVKTDDALRAEKAAHQVSDDLRGKAGVGVDEELRAEKEGVNNNELRAPKEGVSSGDLKAPKDILDSLADLLAPKEAAKSDAELRGPKELVKTNTAAGLSSTDPLAQLRTGPSDSRASNADTEKALAVASEAPTDAQASGAIETPVDFRPGPEMDFPARVVHLKIENDNLRSALDKLESEP
jgi:hypothetical protein